MGTSIASGGSGTEKGKFSIHNPDVGSAQYNAIKTLLSTDIGKNTQKVFAASEVNEMLLMMMDKGIDTPTILIYLADLMNQYGTGIPETLNVASNVCKAGGDMMYQLDKVVEKVKTFKTYYLYQSRRNKTYSYIKDLYNSGKLMFNVPANEQGEYQETNTATFIGESIKGVGKFILPFEGSCKISATWGKNGYKTHVGANKTYPHYHSGIDFALGYGTPLYAVDNGTVCRIFNNTDAWGYAIAINIDGEGVLYAHLSKIAVKVGDVVTQGQYIGDSGNTGGRTTYGAHLHFEVDPTFEFRGNSAAATINPLPKFGYNGDENSYYDKIVSN